MLKSVWQSNVVFSANVFHTSGFARQANGVICSNATASLP